MANSIQLKRSSVAGRIPDTANILVGEPVVNLADKILFTKDGTGNVIVIGAGTTSNIAEGTNLYFTNTRAISAFTEGSGITIDANGLISANVTSSVSDSFSTIAVSGSAGNIVASGSDTLNIDTDGLIVANTNPATKTLTVSLGGNFPFYDSTGAQNSIALRLLESTVQDSYKTIYLPFVKSDGTSVNTLRFQ